jgi:anti-anti-sigma factor
MNTTEPPNTIGPNDGRLEIDVTLQEAENRAEIALQGRIDIFTYQKLSAKLMEVYSDRPALDVILDLSLVAFIASSGWATLLTARSRIRRQGGRIALAGMNDELLRIYEAMKINDLIPNFMNLKLAEEALQR